MEIKTQKNTLRSGHHNGTHVTSDGLSLTEEIRGETGRVELSSTIDQGVKAEIEFRKEYVNPVVVAYIVTRGGGQSVDARVMDVEPTGCTIFMEEPDDQSHNAEYVTYIVMEAGSHITKTGHRIEAGNHETTTVRRGGDDEFTGDEIKFEKIFTTQPAVLHSLNTYRNASFATTMSQNVSVEGFEISQELAETKKKPANEVIGWIAIEEFSGSGFFTGVKGQAGIKKAYQTTNIEEKANTNINFTAGFIDRPDVVVKGQTMIDSDGYWVRGAGAWSKDLTKVYAEEDQRIDKEREHNTEIFGFAAFEENSALMTIRSIGDRVSYVYELGSISIRYPLVTTWKTDNYSKMSVDVKVSSDYGITWSDWMVCEYAKPVPGVPVTGELNGFSVQFKYTFVNDTEVPVHLREFSITHDNTPVIIEGLNVGGYATDGSDWNSKRIL